MATGAISKGIISIGFWSMTKIVVAAVVAPVLSRVLGPDGYGRYAYLMAVLLLCFHPASFGMAQSVTKYIAQRPADTCWHRQIATFAAAINARLATMVGVALAAALLFSGAISSEGVLVTATMVGLLWCDQVVRFASGILFGLHRESEATIPASVGLVVAGAGAVAFAAGGQGVAGVMLGTLLGGMLAATATSRGAMRALHAAGRADPLPAPVRREILRYGLGSMVYGVLGMALYCIDIVLVAHLAAPAQAGLYAAAVQWAQFVWVLPVAVEGVMLQSTARLWAVRSTSEVMQLTAALTRYVAVITAFVLIFVAVFADRIFALYFGQGFEAAGLVLQILVPGSFAMSLSRVMQPVLQAKGDLVPLATAAGLGVLLNAAVGLYAIPRWGAAGAAVGTTLSFAWVVICHIRLLHRAGAPPVSGFPGFRLAGLSLATVILMALIGMAIPSAALAIALGGGLGAVFYFVGAIGLRIVSVDDVDKAVAGLPGPLRNWGLRLLAGLRPLLLRLAALAA